jgi:hypothetical protein
MYACICETGCGFFEVVCTPSNVTAHSYDLPHPQCKRTGALAMGLRPEEGHAPRYRGRRISLGYRQTITRPVPEHRSHATHAPRSMSHTRPSKHRKQVRSS